MFARLNSLGLYGMDAFVVDVEADLSKGMPMFDLVGLPGASVRESRDRVRSAMKNGGFDFPISRITVNLAPADIRKEGPIYDVPILLALLKVTGQLSAGLEGSAFVGELSLDGEIRPVNGLLAMAIKAREAGIRRFFVPRRNAAEASVIEGIEIYPVENIGQLLDHLRGRQPIPPAKPEDFPRAPEPVPPDFS